MAIDPSIPLQVKAPVFQQPDIAGVATKMATLDKARLEMLKEQNSFVASKLAGAKDQASYLAVKQDLLNSGDPKLAEIAAKAPDVYDPTFVNNALMSTLEVKDRLSLLAKQQESEFDREKFSETKRHNMATEANQSKMVGAFGNSEGGRAKNILLSGDPNSPEYALAYMEVSQPQIKPVTQPDGSVQLVAVTPQLPPNIRPPGGMLQPPAMPGTPDSTPTTPQSQLLPNPNQPIRSFNVSPIAGTQGSSLTTEQRNKNVNIDTAKSALEKALDDYSNIVDKGGYAVLPGEQRDAQATARRNVQMQMKELYNLGVLNGPDLDLMNEMLVDATVNPSNALEALYTTGSGAMGGKGIKERVKANTTQLKKQFNDIVKSRREVLGGSTGNTQPNTDFKTMSDDEIRKSLGL